MLKMQFLPGGQEWLVIILLVLLLFGASKLPEVARNLGKSVAEFKKAQREAELELREFERNIAKYSQSEKRKKLEEIAMSLGIETSGKSDDEIIEEIKKKIEKEKA